MKTLILLAPLQISPQRKVSLLDLVKPNGQLVDLVLGDCVLFDQNDHIFFDFLHQILLVADIPLQNLVLRFVELAALPQRLQLAVELLGLPFVMLALAFPISNLVASLLKVALLSFQHLLKLYYPEVELLDLLLEFGPNQVFGLVFLFASLQLSAKRILVRPQLEILNRLCFTFSFMVSISASFSLTSLCFSFRSCWRRSFSSSFFSLSLSVFLSN